MEFRRILPRPVYVRSFNPRVIFSDHRPRVDAFECSAPTTPPTPSILSKKSAFKRRHRHPKKLACPFCNSKFRHKGHLNAHMRGHTGEKPYQCPQCQRRFARKADMQRHSRLHSGVRPFRCDKCDTSFSRKEHLKAHEKTRLHLGENP